MMAILEDGPPHLLIPKYVFDLKEIGDVECNGQKMGWKTLSLLLSHSDSK